MRQHHIERERPRMIDEPVEHPEMTSFPRGHLADERACLIERSPRARDLPMQLQRPRFGHMRQREPRIRHDRLIEGFQRSRIQRQYQLASPNVALACPRRVGCQTQPISIMMHRKHPPNGTLQRILGGEYNHYLIVTRSVDSTLSRRSRRRSRRHSGELVPQALSQLPPANDPGLDSAAMSDR